MNAQEAGKPAGQAAVEELRALGLQLLDRLEPLVARLPDLDHAEWTAADADHRCASCPFCAAVAGLRGEQADAVVRHLAGLLAALRAALAEGGAGPARTDAPAPAAPRPERVVQRIPVERAPPC